MCFLPTNINETIVAALKYKFIFSNGISAEERVLQFRHSQFVYVCPCAPTLCARYAVLGHVPCVCHRLSSMNERIRTALLSVFNLSNRRVVDGDMQITVK